MIEVLKEIFGDESLTFDQLAEKLKGNDGVNLVNAADGSYVPKSDFDAVSSQLAEAQTEAQANAEKYKDFDAQLQAAKDEGTQALNSYKRDVELSKAFTEANVADEVSVRANLNLDEVQLGDDGKLTGLDDQLTALKEAKPFLFKEPERVLELGGSTQGAGGRKEIKGIEGAVADFYSGKDE